MGYTVTPSALWSEFGSANGVLPRALRFAVLAGGALLLGFTGTLPLAWPQQLLVAGLTILLAVWINRRWSSHQGTLTLLLLSVYSTYRYGFWRVTSVIAFFGGPGARWTALSGTFVVLLLLAECHAFATLLLGFMRMLWPLARKPVALSDDMEQWPAVDVLIPTYDEPLSVVRFTALAALNIDWPAEKLKVYLLDDGGREEFRAFAAEAGIGYMARGNTLHAKAGNINHALQRTGSPFVAIFNADHVPTRSILQIAMGWFVRDPKLAFVQTPQHLRLPGIFERTLGGMQLAEHENDLSHGAVQDGNDFWDATIFCGSCAAMRRSALDDVGGMAVESVAGDARTSLRMQMRGWRTAYINIPQAAGLATESLSQHLRQRIRWARGMAQALRSENPLFAPGLNPAQRFCYLSSMANLLFAAPRLIFLAAPLVYLIFGGKNIPGYWLMIVAYALPHLVLSGLGRARIDGRHRNWFWNGVYETVLAPYLLLPTAVALFGTRARGFDGTPRGGAVERKSFDARVAWPYLALLALEIFGLLCAIPRAVRFPSFDLPPGLCFVNWPASLYDGGHLGTILLNAAWALYSAILLAVATGVAWESGERRAPIHMARAVPTEILLGDGSMARGVSAEISGDGVYATLNRAVHVEAGDRVRFVVRVLEGTAMLPATVIEAGDRTLRAQFGALTLEESEALTLILYSRADTWLEAREDEHPLRGLGRILRLSLHGIAQTVGALPGIAWRRGGKSLAKGGFAASVVPLLLLAGFVCGSSTSAQAARAARAVDNTSDAAKASPANDLSLLPLPFYDPAAALHPVVSVVFLAPPTAKAMRAAGIVASWFGVQADERALRFAVSVGTIPAGNAIVIAEDARAIPASLGMAAVSGPTVAVRANPSDLNSKLLLVTGGNADETVQAAIGLSLERNLLQGAQMSVVGLKMPGARQPDDAPRWLSTERSTELGESAQAGELQGDGSAPVSVTLRLPPDLYYAQRQELAFHLSYRYNGVPLGSQSTLQMYVNGGYVSSTPMPHTEKASMVLETTVPIPVVEMHPFDNTLTFQFDFQRKQQAEGEEAAHNLEGAVLPDSALDIGGIEHWATLPNLALFANAGYPFTRMADLAETSVVLPDEPTAGELEVYLDLMGHFGAQTGYPALNVAVTDAAGMAREGNKDTLVLGSVDDQPALKMLDAVLPVAVDRSGLHVRDTEGFFQRAESAWWRVRGAEPAQRGELETAGGLPDALIEGAEWPRGSARTVVAVVLRDPASASEFASAFLEQSQTAAISQSVSVLLGERFASYRIGGAVYHVGALSFEERAAMEFTERPWLIVLAVAGFCFAMAAVAAAMLRRRAQARLLGSE